MFKQRLGADPHANGAITSSGDGCPDIWELQDGSFAIIGVRKTEELKGILPATANCGADEEIIVIPRQTLIGAKNDIPQH